MSLYPKFILTTDGHLRLGMVHLHRELLEPQDHCAGGGFYRFDAVEGRLLLERESYDYGPPRWSAVDRLIVPRDYEGLRLVYVSSAWPYDEHDLTSLFGVTYE